jgi:hypothetical protein
MNHGCASSTKEPLYTRGHGRIPRTLLRKQHSHLCAVYAARFADYPPFIVTNF